jgi:hypothetical protein
MCKIEVGGKLCASASRRPDPSVGWSYPARGAATVPPLGKDADRSRASLTGLRPCSLLVTYHAELPNDALYAALGLAASTDNGLHWTDLGEIIRLNQAYAVGLDGFEIGHGPLGALARRQVFLFVFSGLDRQRYAAHHEP